MKLYHCADARSLRPLWALEELGADYELVNMAFPPRATYPGYLSINPLGTVPTFVDGDVTLTECQMVNQFKGSKTKPPQFTRGYGLVFGHAERKAMGMALVDRAMRHDEFAEEPNAPAQNVEFVLYHSDNIEGTGFVEHLKLPHYVDFQSELETIRRMRREAEANNAAAALQETAPAAEREAPLPQDKVQ